MIPSIRKLLTCITHILKHLTGKNKSLHNYLFSQWPTWIMNCDLLCFRAECAGNPVRFFVIISMQRSGSGWFETLLNSHTNVSSNGEIFSVNSRRSNISSIIRTLDRVYNLDWFNSASKNECSAAVGFKWMLNQVNSKRIPRYIVYYLMAVFF